MQLFHSFWDTYNILQVSRLIESVHPTPNMKAMPFQKLIYLLSFIPFLVNGQQYLSNGDFEGTHGQDVIPPGWSKCHNFSTPDTQPGSWNVTTSPSKGESFTNLVTRGDQGPYAHTTEDMQAQLLIPLKTNETYVFTMDLANSDSWGHFIGWTDTWVSYADPVVLNVYLSSVGCDKSNLVWTSTTIDHTEWKKYTFEVTPNSEKQYVILEAEWATAPDYFGNVLIDDFKIKLKDEEEEGSEGIISGECDLQLPNAFTPNGDRDNEVFSRFSQTDFDPLNFDFQIFNRWGSIVYSSSNPDFDWDGTDGSGNEYSVGTYFFVSQYTCLDNGSPTEKQKKGWIALLR